MGFVHRGVDENLDFDSFWTS